MYLSAIEDVVRVIFPLTMMRGGELLPAAFKLREQQEGPEKYLSVVFMYSLYESCKLNDLNFYDYINDVLTRLMKGETDYKSLIPCNYKPLPSEEEQKGVA